mmetsp:Transcript_63412/g.138084  ORF Transcript_63412/g.138084 Transcript_63412/m.138084 type:complete len:236 (-) Transcript_63412:170-877(-)
MAFRSSAAWLLAGSLGIATAQYSTNAICRERNCINPVFPGMNDLSLLQATQWQCQSAFAASPYMNFCGPAVNYDVAVPNPNTTITLQQAVASQDEAALTMYYYHLAGMGMEAWDYKTPSTSGNDCVKSVWKMVCHTYFPRAEAGCAPGQSTAFMRPCKNVCTRYTEACDVQCCDESAKCVFNRTVSLISGGQKQVEGYSSIEGPSAMCTGAASRSSWAAAAVALFLAMAALPLGN